VGREHTPDEAATAAAAAVGVSGVQPGQPAPPQLCAADLAKISAQDSEGQANRLHSDKAECLTIAAALFSRSFLCFSRACKQQMDRERSKSRLMQICTHQYPQLLSKQAAHGSCDFGFSTPQQQNFNPHPIDMKIQ
jgi:hypothetical protein